MCRLVLIMLVSVIAVYFQCVSHTLIRSPSLKSHPGTLDGMTTLFTHEQHVKFSKVTLRSTVNGKPHTVIDVSNVSSGVHAQLPSCNSSIVPKFGFHTSDAILKKVTYTGVISYAHYTYSDKADVIELINGCIYCVLVLFILWHISILILTFVFFSLDFCFNSIRKRQNNQKVHCQSTSPFRLIEMLIPAKIFHSDTICFCLMTVIINHSTIFFESLLPLS